MTDKIISKKTDSLIHKMRDIRDGRNPDFLFCEGQKPAQELLQSGWNPSWACCRKDTQEDARRLLTDFQKSSIPLYVLSDTVMEFVSDVKSPPGLVIICKRNQQTATESPTANPLILVLHGQQLPQNMGGMIRTAEGAGVTSIWVTQNTVDPLSAKSIRASSGSVFRMSLRRQKDLSDYVHALKKEKILVVAADQDGDIDYDGFDWSQPVALIMGAEGAGFADKEKEMFDRLVRIPMAGRLESLNVGVAAAICLFEAARQRRAKGKKS